MNIYVNDQKLDAQLSGEKTVKEIYDEIYRWSENQKKYILSLAVDQQEVAVSGLKDIPTTNVQRLDFYMGNEIEMVLSTLNELDHYMDQIGNTLFENKQLNPADRTHLTDGIHWIRQIMDSIATILHLDLKELRSPYLTTPGETSDETSDEETAEQAVVEDFINGLEQKVSHLQNDDDSIVDFLNDLRAFKFFIMKLQLQLQAMNTEFEDLLQTLTDFDKNIPELKEKIIAINTAFNAGRDKNALEDLDRFTGRLDHYLAALFALDQKFDSKQHASISQLKMDEQSFRSKIDAMTMLLKELCTALEEQDMVAAGDILEYEITQQLDDIRPFLGEIQQLMVASK